MNLTRLHAETYVDVRETERTEGFSCRPPSALCRSVGSTSEPDRQMDLSADAC